MSAILVLLGLLSVATLASRRGYAAFIAHIVTTPILLGVGLLLSPTALGFFTEAVAEALLPAMRVGAAWLALLVGLRTVPPRLDRQWASSMAATLGASGLSWLFIAAAAYGVLVASSEAEMGFTDPAGSRLSAIGAAILLGGLVAGTGLSIAREALQDRLHEPATRLLTFIARHDEIVSAAAVCAAIFLWPLQQDLAPVYADEWAPVAVIVGLGFTLFLAQLLTGGSKQESAGPQALIAILGLLVFASGLSTTAVLPDAAIAYFFGAFVAASGRGAHLLRSLRKTERPVRLVVLTLVGAHLGFTAGALLVGLAMAGARLLAKLVVRSTLLRTSGEPLALASLLGGSGLAVPFALSFALSRPGDLGESEILTAVCVCVSLSDVATLIAWRRAGRELVQAPPELDGVDAIPSPDARAQRAQAEAV